MLTTTSYIWHASSSPTTKPATPWSGGSRKTPPRPEGFPSTPAPSRASSTGTRPAQRRCCSTRPARSSAGGPARSCCWSTATSRQRTWTIIVRRPHWPTTKLLGMDSATHSVTSPWIMRAARVAMAKKFRQWSTTWRRSGSTRLGRGRRSWCCTTGRLWFGWRSCCCGMRWCSMKCWLKFYERSHTSRYQRRPQRRSFQLSNGPLLLWLFCLFSAWDAIICCEVKYF